MDEITKLKKELKVWEGSFLKDHGRKPGKVGVRAFY